MRYGNPLKLGRIKSNGCALELSPTQRGKHAAIFGSTGTGKSKLVEHAVRSDILAWPQSRSGVVLLDPHGSLFDGVMRWVAADDFRRWPIIPIDLRRDDWVVAYNLLRKREGDPAVFVSAFARAILHAWGQVDMNETPQLYKWLRTILGTLYEHQATLADGLRLIADPEVRRMMTGELRDPFARTVWDAASRLRNGEFNDEVRSTLSRLLKFLSNRAIKASLCQTEVSLDLSQALDQGAIVLVCLATEGGRIDEEDAATFGSLLLSDLWTAAKARGKRDEGDPKTKPCYVYLDEFQKFLSPVMAETLDQARGFGLHFTLSSQYPTKMLVSGEIGRQVYHSIMANCRTKVVFSLEHPDDLPQLALWLYRQQIDPDQIKHQQATTKVMGYQLAYMPSTSYSETDTTGGAESEGSSHTSGTGGAQSHSIGRSTTDSYGGSSGASDGESYLESDDWDNEPRKTLSHTDCEGESFSSSETKSESWTDTSSWDESDTTSSSTSSNWSNGVTRGVTHSPMLFPIMGQELLPPQFRSVEEQLFQLSQYLAGQPDRHCVARLAGEALPVALVTFDVEDGCTTRRWAERFSHLLYGRIDCALPFPEAWANVERRDAQIAGKMMDLVGTHEPTTAKRRVEAMVVADRRRASQGALRGATGTSDTKTPATRRVGSPC